MFNFLALARPAVLNIVGRTITKVIIVLFIRIHDLSIQELRLWNATLILGYHFSISYRSHDGANET